MAIRVEGRVKCGVCGQAKDCRIDAQDTAYGPLMRPTCCECYAKDVAERRAEGRRFHYRPRIVGWDQLDRCAVDVEVQT